jgi:excisionase family DNA binding protein
MAKTKTGLTEEDRTTRAFTVTQAAEYLSINRKTMLKLCQDGTIKAVKIGHDWRIGKAELDRMLAGG